MCSDNQIRTSAVIFLSNGEPNVLEHTTSKIELQISQIAHYNSNPCTAHFFHVHLSPILFSKTH